MNVALPFLKSSSMSLGSTYHFVLCPTQKFDVLFGGRSLLSPRTESAFRKFFSLWHSSVLGSTVCLHTVVCSSAPIQERKDAACHVSLRRLTTAWTRHNDPEHLFRSPPPFSNPVAFRTFMTGLISAILYSVPFLFSLLRWIGTFFFIARRQAFDFPTSHMNAADRFALFSVPGCLPRRAARAPRAWCLSTALKLSRLASILFRSVRNLFRPMFAPFRFNLWLALRIKDPPLHSRSPLLPSSLSWTTLRPTLPLLLLPILFSILRGRVHVETPGPAFGRRPLAPL